MGGDGAAQSGGDHPSQGALRFPAGADPVILRSEATKDLGLLNRMPTKLRLRAQGGIMQSQSSVGLPEEGAVIVRGAASGFAQEIHVGRHRLASDEPAAAGGTDTGPTPYHLLLAASGLEL